MHVGIFDLEHVKVIWGHSVHFSENWAVTQQLLIVERNGRKVGVYVIFDLEHVRVIWVIWCTFPKKEFGALFREKYKK